MKRDLDLIRKIMLIVENEPSDSVNRIDVSEIVNRLEDKYDEATVFYHFQLLNDSNFITGISCNTIGHNDYIIERLTSDGCDYLDNVRNEKVWNKTVEKLKSYGGGAALNIVSNVAGAILKEMLMS